MTKKFSWEADKASLTLRVSDGAKETTWKIRKNTPHSVLLRMLVEIRQSMLIQIGPEDMPNSYPRPMVETVRTVDAEELAELQGRGMTEEQSRAAQAALAASKSINAKWWDSEDDEIEDYVVMLPDYDAGEIK